MKGVEYPVIARKGYNTLVRVEPHRHGEARIKPESGLGRVRVMGARGASNRIGEISPSGMRET
jgi:hypothetical protein